MSLKLLPALLGSNDVQKLVEADMGRCVCELTIKRLSTFALLSFTLR